ncbi:MAG: 5'-nucleotidase C-terminal domain-containing protein [Blautia sp.]|nr:5'-nucleotidase C-terminal domain-containing protein [Blautia sp.]
MAFVNGSGIREDIKRGDITMNDIMKTLPYGTKLVIDVDAAGDRFV